MGADMMHDQFTRTLGRAVDENDSGSIINLLSRIEVGKLPKGSLKPVLDCAVDGGTNEIMDLASIILGRVGQAAVQPLLAELLGSNAVRAEGAAFTIARILTPKAGEEGIDSAIRGHSSDVVMALRKYSQNSASSPIGIKAAKEAINALTIT